MQVAGLSTVPFLVVPCHDGMQRVHRESGTAQALNVRPGDGRFSWILVLLKRKLSATHKERLEICTFCLKIEKEYGIDYPYLEAMLIHQVLSNKSSRRRLPAAARNFDGLLLRAWLLQQKPHCRFEILASCQMLPCCLHLTSACGAQRQHGSGRKET